ncbi:esterase EstP [Pseudomonas chlororaphis]|uniref:Outer membrane autotransporter barrel protein n=2 Tax=Pseudomonas chlororaphis TaxID=587753 RepID=A0AAX3FXS8_9PSED|nr:esterase EstP [Pseudomonas chlororaphis]AZC40363.1 Phospholipase/lecithinase/hemolysin [Pseudomonas chlororaphis subsp. piscium]AZC46921.1 Phospholipase/lecithinase/hemolysin [Pseudomonas chlororaphis subsp. piscium]WDG72403.1 autotransporter domain-containing protein [Pseudomonas chlororaphis]WDH29811.1 autotransporter domain-containing protein [Pseudomonas chlororaphis]WDH70925.1 autotransporter domain-containing protein [Pseudomonas chlororaphis]
MIRQKLFVPLASSLLSLACAQAIAAPSPYSSFIVFGDSLSDAGQFADPGGPAGATQRFTNRTGPVYLDGSGELRSANSTQLLGAKLGFSDDQLAASTSATRASEGLPDGNNWAVGGYRTDQILDSITTTSTAGSRSRPGYLVANNFRADPNALYYLSGGGNDFLQGRVTSLDQANAAAGRLVDSVQTLQQAGARYIMVWLLPDIGLTPAINGSPLQGFTSQLSAQFNTELVRQLQTVDAEVIPLNIPALLKESFANPAQFGLATDQNLTATCFSGNGCTENARYGIHSATPDPSKLIYNDSVHPTEAGQRLIADYAYSLLAAPWEITLLPEMAQGTLRAHQDELRNQWQADWENWQSVGQWRAIVAAGGQHQDFDSQRSGASADGNGFNLNIGGSYRLNEAWRVGVLAGAYRQKLEAGGNDSDYKLNTYLGTAFVQYQQNRWWADAAATAGHLDYDNLKRKFDLGPNERGEKGDTSGDILAFSARLGYDIAQQASSPWHLSPFISADYARAKVDGYSEDGSDSTALTFDDQKRTSRRLGIGLQGKYQITQQTQVFGEIAHEKEYEDDTQKLTMALNSLPDNRYTLEGYTPQTNLNRLNLGVSHKLTQDLALRASYNIRKDDDFTQQGINVGVSLDF